MVTQIFHFMILLPLQPFFPLALSPFLFIPLRPSLSQGDTLYGGSPRLPSSNSYLLLGVCLLLSSYSSSFPKAWLKPYWYVIQTLAQVYWGQ